MGYINVVKNAEVKLPNDAILGTDNCNFNLGILSMYSQDMGTPNSGIQYPITIPNMGSSDTLELVIPITNFKNTGASRDRPIFFFYNSNTLAVGANVLWLDNYSGGGNAYRIVYADQNGHLDIIEPASGDLSIGVTWLKMIFNENSISIYTSNDGATYGLIATTSFAARNAFNNSMFNIIGFGSMDNGSQYIGSYGLNASIDLVNCSLKLNSQKLRDFVVS